MRQASKSDEAGRRRWMCMNCGLIYDEAQGDLQSGIAPGTRWEDVPPDWKCPDCGSPKSDFEMVEV